MTLQAYVGVAFVFSLCSFLTSSLVIKSLLWLEVEKCWTERPELYELLIGAPRLSYESAWVNKLLCGYVQATCTLVASHMVNYTIILQFVNQEPMFCHIMTVYSVSFCVFLNVILYCMITIYTHSYYICKYFWHFC